QRFSRTIRRTQPPIIHPLPGRPPAQHTAHGPLVGGEPSVIGLYCCSTGGGSSGMRRLSE
ncbi:MAG: hypothetical protein PHV05_13195, partial [Candidatus Riflebacteria bacterium]|nr:hypothetical protein [Candidatus Riflebacteria bacterium]